MAGEPAKGGASPSVVLTLNSGSSSLKFGLYRVGGARTEELLTGAAEAIGDANGAFHARDSQARILTSESVSIPGRQDALVRIVNLLDRSGLPAPVAIGHRIVHGGPDLRQHCVIDEVVMRQLEDAVSFAPLHAPSALAVIRSMQRHFAGLPNVACFDTTFHAAMPDVARVLPLPRDLKASGIRRYGFHGLSCESIVHQLGEFLPQRLIIAHLGNGASVTAVDTSMGLTPSGGGIMGSRSGDIDPGVLIYLMRERKFDPALLEDLIDHRSGLTGISGVGSDMRRLHDAASSNPDARLAIEMFCYSVRKQIAAMMAALGGVDLLVFTGGIGENDGKVRASICSGLSWAGVGSDAIEDIAEYGRVPSAQGARVLVLPSREDRQIARHTGHLVGLDP